MKVFWDGYGLSNPHSGIGRYGTQLCDALKSIDVAPDVIDASAGPTPLAGFVRAVANSKPIAPCRNLHVIHKKFSSQPGNAVLHALSNINLCVFTKKAKNLRYVLTVHDIIPLLAPHDVSRGYFLQFSWLMPRVLELADHVVCPSNWTKSEIIARYPKTEHKISHISNGFSAERNEGDANLGEKTGGLKLLVVSRDERYKRLDLALDIFQNLVKSKKTAEITLNIVTCARGAQRLRKRIGELGIGGFVEVFNDVTRPFLRTLYADATALLHPSRYEGFCIPTVEAQEFGLPVIYAKGSGIDEVVCPHGSRGLEVDASLEEWVRAVIDVLELSPSAREGTMQAIKIFQSNKPTWLAAAKSIKSIYQQLV